MGYPLKVNSAARALAFFLADATDNVTPLTGASGIAVSLSKNSGAFAAAAGAISEIGNGWYQTAGSATDTNTLGPLLLHATATGAVPYDTDFAVETNLLADLMLASSYVAPDNADIVTALGDVVALLTRTDPTVALTILMGLLENVGGYRFTTHALMQSPSASGTVNANVIEWAGVAVDPLPASGSPGGTTSAPFVGNTFGVVGLMDVTIQVYQSTSGGLVAFGTPVAMASGIHENPDGDGTYTITPAALVAALLAQTPSKVLDLTMPWYLSWKSTTIGAVPFDGYTITPDLDVTAASIAAQTAAALAGAPITYTGPMLASGNAEVVLADDYHTATGRQLSWNFTGAADLTGAQSVKLYVPSIPGLTDTNAVACTVTNAGQATQTVTAQLSTAQTALLTQGNNPFYILAILSNGDKDTILVNGNIEGEARVS